MIFDDATSEVYDVQLVDEESTVTVMAALKRVVEQRGSVLFACIRIGEATWPGRRKREARDRAQSRPRSGRALKQLGIDLILAYSPQARGRCERLFGTWQGRLPQEFRLRNITTVEAANEFLRQDWIAIARCRVFVSRPSKRERPFFPIRERIWRRSFRSSRNGSSTTTTRSDSRSRCLQIPQQTFRFSLARCRVLVCEHLDQTISRPLWAIMCWATMTRQASSCGSRPIRNRGRRCESATRS